MLEVQDELGNNQVRCLAMGSTDGLVRGAAVMNTGGPITVPVGEGTLGRIFNVLGKAIDSDEPVKAAAILADPPRRRRNFEVAGSDAEDLRDRHQGHRPDGAVHARR